MSLRFNRKDSAQAREKKLNALLKMASDQNAVRLPVGAIYTTVSTANPAASLGYGVWRLIGSGNLFT